MQEIVDRSHLFLSWRYSYKTNAFFCFIWVLKVSLRVTLIQKRGLDPLRLLHLMRVLFVSLQGRAPGKNEGNENKIMLGDLNCTVDKIDRNGENKTQRRYRCCSNYALYKLIVDNWIEDLWRREDPYSPEFICYDRSFAKDQYRPSILIFGKEPIVVYELGGICVLPSP